jgi:hypothetical protein
MAWRLKVRRPAENRETGFQDVCNRAARFSLRKINHQPKF